MVKFQSISSQDRQLNLLDRILDYNVQNSMQNNMDERSQQLGKYIDWKSKYDFKDN